MWEGTIVNLSHASSSKDMRVRDCQCGNKLKKARRADEEMVVEGDHAKRSDRRSHVARQPWMERGQPRGRGGLAEELLLQRA